MAQIAAAAARIARWTASRWLFLPCWFRSPAWTSCGRARH